jgi:hypothetical protein
VAVVIDERLLGDEGEHGRGRGFRAHAVHARTRLFRGAIGVVIVNSSDVT